MTEGISSKKIWNEAAKTGLILGFATIACQEITVLLDELINSAFLKSLLNILLWAVKFGGCIFLMREFLKKFAAANSDATVKTLRHYGEAIAILSALLVGAFSLINYLYINPNLVDQALEIMRNSYSSMLTASQMDEIENVAADLPVISFFTVFLYCTLYGTILSAILSNNILGSKSIFDEPDDQDEQ